MKAIFVCNLIETEHEQGMAGRDGDTLFSVYFEGHDVRIHFGAGLEIPQRLSGFSIERVEISFERPTENQTSGGRQHAGPRRGLEFEFPLGGSSHGVEGADGSPGLIACDGALASA